MSLNSRRWLLVGILSWANPALAAEIHLGGLLFTHFEYVVSEHLADGTTSYDQNSFEVGRVYFNTDVKTSDRTRGFLQLEANLVTRENTANAVFLKQALLEITEIYPQGNLMAGLIPNPWRAWAEGLWKHRFAARVFDDSEGLLSATDRGARVSGKLSYLDYDFYVVNGEGTKANEVKGSKYKDAAVKAAAAPFGRGPMAAFKINAYLQQGAYGQGLARDRIFYGLSYESSRANAMLNFYNSKDKKTSAGAQEKGRGFSAGGFCGISDSYWIFGRYDQWDPDRRKDDDGRGRIIAGVGRQLAAGVRAAIDYQTLLRQKETATGKDEGIGFLHFELKF